MAMMMIEERRIGKPRGPTIHVETSGGDGREGQEIAEHGRPGDEKKDHADIRAISRQALKRPSNESILFTSDDDQEGGRADRPGLRRVHEPAVDAPHHDEENEQRLPDSAQGLHLLPEAHIPRGGRRQRRVHLDLAR